METTENGSTHSWVAGSTPTLPWVVNDDEDHDDEEEYVTPYCKRVIRGFATFKIILGISGLLSNPITIYIFYKERKKYTLYRSIIALSVVDCCFIISDIIDLVMQHYVEESENLDFDTLDMMREFFETLTEHVRFALVWTTVCLCYERYKVLCKPLAPEDGTKYLWLRLGLVAVCSFLFALPEYLDGFGASESFDTQPYEIAFEIFVFYTLILVIPTGLLVYCTYHLGQTVKGDASSLVQSANKHKNSLTKSLIFIIVIFLIANSMDPIMTIFDRVIEDFEDDSQNCYSFLVILNEMTEIVMVVNSCINFYVYLYFNQQFRRRFAMIYKKKTSRVEDVSTATGDTY